MTLRKNRLSAALLTAIAAVLLTGVTTAAAAEPDTDAAPDAQATNSTTGQSGNVNSTEKSATELGNVTVTAQSRTQQVQDVPIPVQIVTSAQIDKLAATDLSKMD